MTGDREYIGRGFVPETRTLTEEERAKIQWTMSAASEQAPASVGIPGGVYGRQYMLRYLEYGDAKGTLPALPKGKSPPPPPPPPEAHARGRTHARTHARLAYLRAPPHGSAVSTRVSGAAVASRAPPRVEH